MCSVRYYMFGGGIAWRTKKYIYPRPHMYGSSFVDFSRDLVGKNLAKSK